MTGAILGKKIGMTTIFSDDGRQLPCTVVEAGPCRVIQVKTVDNDGYSSVQLGFGETKANKVNRPLKGHFEKVGVKPKKYLKEFRDFKQDFEIGQELTVEQFRKGDKVKISGKSKGKGFQGVVKRHGFHGVGMMTHGQSDRQRHGGSIGQSSDPSKVFKGVKMPGRMGGDKVSIRNIEVIDILPDQNIILLKGSIPGHKNSVLEIYK